MKAQVGTVIDGKYEILKQIGEGGMSTVYLAMDKRLNKQWAVKEISRKGFGKNNEEIVNKVPADADMMKGLDHPSIPTVVGIIDQKENDYIYVVMDYVEGESLDKVLNEFGAQPQDLVVDWVMQICDALGYLHAQKPPIVYRDMKPGNVMLKPEGNIKIIDFGIAREYKEGNLADTSVLGTRGYASPEHYGGRQTTPLSDIYTIGMTMHHLLTGVDPRPSNYEYAPIRQWNPELSDGLERIIDKCVSPDPKDRYQSCNELLYALAHYHEEEEKYKSAQKKKGFTFLLSLVLAVIFAITGVVMNVVASNTENSNYNNLISIVNTDYDTAIERINKAVAIDKVDIRAYEQFLDYIIADENISETESQGFSTIFNQAKANFADENYNEEFANLSYEAGINHFFYYEVDLDNSNPRARALKAIRYFSDIKDGNYAVSEIAEHFFTICNFYKKDSGNSVESVNYREHYEQIFSSIDKCIDFLDSYSESNANFVKAAMYKSAIDFIHTNIIEISNPEYANIDKTTVLNMLNKVYEKANSINEILNDNSRAYQTRKYVIDKIPEYTTQVKVQYENLSR